VAHEHDEDELLRSAALRNVESILLARRRAEEALRESEERFRLLANMTPNVVWTARPDGTITFSSDQWYQYTGLTAEENARAWARLVLHPDDYQRCVEQWTAALRDGLAYEIEVRNRRHDGAYRWWMTRAVPVKDEAGRITAWFGSSTDIHDLKVAQEALRESDRRKDEFLAMLAHELRNPLAPIRNALQILRLTGGNGQADAPTFDMMERQLGQMVRLIDDLLDVSRISRGKIELKRQRVELASVVHHAVEAARPLCEGLGHELTVALPLRPIYLTADPARLAQVVGNLLNNACKFTERGGRIDLTVAREGEHAVIRVRDTGIGIAPNDLPRIFEMFAQVDATRERSQGGLGLGLTLVKNLVEMHGGTVEARSGGVGQGAEFIVRLPVLAEPLPLSPPGPADVGWAAAPRRILVVDDNRDAADSLAMLLRLARHDVHTANDGLEAVALAASVRPDVILLDLGLPKLSGYEAARRIREQCAGSGPVLVALTGWGQEEDRRRSKEAGFNAHLVKPVDHAALTKLLAEVGVG
jgi:PAS domain S-box-containing protein